LVPGVPDITASTVFLQFHNGKEKLLLHIPWRHMGKAELYHHS